MSELIQRTDDLNTGREKLNNAIKHADKAITDSEEALQTANLSLSMSENTQNQLNQVVIEGDSSVEAAQARVDAKGNPHTTLKERLDFEHNQLSSQLAQITKNEVIVIGSQNKEVDTENVQAAIDNATSGTKVVLTGVFNLERIYLKSHITLDLRKATIICVQPSYWTIIETDDYTRTFYLNGVEDVEFIDGIFEGSGTLSDRTTAIFGRNAKNIRLSGKQKFKNLSHGIQFQNSERIIIDTLIGDTLNGSYAGSEGLRAAVISAQGTSSVNINSIQSHNSRKDVLYLGSTSTSEPCRDWAIGSIVSKVTYKSPDELDNDWYGFSNTLHLRSVENLVVESVISDGGYASVDLQATTPDTTNDRVHNVKIGSIVARRILGRDAIIMASPTTTPGENGHVSDVEIGSIQLLDAVGTTSISTANIYMNLVNNVKIGAIIGVNSAGNLVRLNNSSEVDIESISAKNIHRNDKNASAIPLVVRGAHSKNVSIGSIFVDGKQNDGTNSLDPAVELAHGDGIKIDHIATKNVESAIRTFGAVKNIEIDYVYSENSDYILQVRDDTENMSVYSYHGKNIKVEEIRSGKSYTAPRENKINLIRKSREINNPQWAGNPPLTGSFLQGDRWWVNKPTVGEVALWVNTQDGSPNWQPVQMGVKTSVSGTPSFVGQIAVVGGVGYLATGTSSPADWKQIT